MNKKFRAQLFSQQVLHMVTQVLIWALSLNIICENLVNNSLNAADSRVKTKRVKRIADSSSVTKSNSLSGVSGGIITGNSCTVTVPGANADPRDYTNVNNCASGFCSGGICVDQCAGTDKGALGQPCCDQIGIDAGLCSTLSLCCSSTYSCDLNNSAVYNENALAQCCITGAVSPGNHKMACTADTDCCQNAICTLDATDPDQNSYCVTCSTSSETCKDGVLCCNNQLLNCVDGTCEDCIGQNCATGTACCPESVIPGIFCGINQAGTVDRCCVKANFGCNVDQDCCAGNNCVIDNTIPGNNGKGVCTPCSSKIGDICSLKQPCCSSNSALSCLITSTEPGATGTCQSSCSLSSDCNPDFFCNAAADSATSGTCEQCTGAACTGYDGDICNDDCDATVYECRSSRCQQKLPPTGKPVDATDNSSWGVWAGVGAGAAVVIAGGVAYYIKVRRDGSIKTFLKPTDTAEVSAGYATFDRGMLPRARRGVAAARTRGVAAAPAADQVRAVRTASMGDTWQNIIKNKLGAITSSATPITDNETIGILRALNNMGRVKLVATLAIITLPDGIEINLSGPDRLAAVITIAPSYAPISPELVASTKAFIKTMITTGFKIDAASRPTTLTDLLGEENNMEIMRKVWSAAYYEVVRKGVEPTEDAILKYLIEEANFKDLFSDDSPFKTIVGARKWFTDQNIDEFFAKAFAISGGQPTPEELLAASKEAGAPTTLAYKNLISDLIRNGKQGAAALRLAFMLAGEEYSLTDDQLDRYKENPMEIPGLSSETRLKVGRALWDAIKGWVSRDQMARPELFRPL